MFKTPVILALLATVWIGCDSTPKQTMTPWPGDGDGDSGAGEEDAGSGTGSEDAGTFCDEGETCTCDNGATGTTTCPGETCDCQQCPPFAPATKDFNACGGEPFGTWKLKSADASSIATSLLNENGQYIGTCQVYATRPVKGDWRLSILDGGEAAGVFEASLSYTELKSCLADNFGYSLGCEDLLLQDGSCHYAGCGLCKCDVDHVSNQESTTWSRSEGTLYVSPSSFAYCVEGDTMKLRDDLGIVYELERFHGRGTPMACALRAHDKCASGLGCTVGGCVGGSKCAAAGDQTSCLTFAGCSWDDSLCTGVAADTCSLGDYGTVPGCEAVAGPAPCVGTPSGCEEAGASCTTIPGCSFVAESCTGDAIECESLFSQTECEDYGCSWSGGCVGTPVECGKLTSEQCLHTPGCSFE